MRQMVKVGVAALAVVASAACSADGGGLGPDPMSFSPGMASVEPVCTTIDFEGFDHLEAFGNQLEAFGLTLSVTGSIYVADNDNDPPAQPAGPVAFNTDFAGVTSDPDLQTAFDCPGCAPLDHIMILPDFENGLGDDAHGDYRWGGTMRIDGFTGGNYYLESFVAVDQEDATGAVRVLANGVGLLGQAAAGANGGVQTVNTLQTEFTDWIEFQLGTEVNSNPDINGSGGVDDIVICQVPPPPPSDEETRTPGYWKNDKKDWPVNSLVVGGVLYDRATADDLMEHPTKKDKTYNMFEQLVATMLNLEAGTEASCIQDVVNDANTWMTTYGPGDGVAADSDAWQDPDHLGLGISASELHATLDAYNNGLLCAPHAD